MLVGLQKLVNRRSIFFVKDLFYYNFFNYLVLFNVKLNLLTINL